MVIDEKLIADAYKIAGGNAHLVGEAVSEYRSRVYWAARYPNLLKTLSEEFKLIEDALTRFVVSSNIQFLQDWKKEKIFGKGRKQ